MNIQKAKRALKGLIDTVDTTGGLVEVGDDGSLAPAGDPSWLDLADVYIDACEALGLKPKIQD